MIIYNKKQTQLILNDLNLTEKDLDQITRFEFIKTLKQNNWDNFEHGSDRQVFSKKGFDMVIKVDDCGRSDLFSAQGEIERRMFERYGYSMAEIYAVSNNRVILFCESVDSNIVDFEYMTEHYPDLEFVEACEGFTFCEYETYLLNYIKEYFEPFEDMHLNNVGINKYKELVVLDAGYGDVEEDIIAQSIYYVLKNNLHSNFSTLYIGAFKEIEYDFCCGKKLYEAMKKYYPNFKENEKEE